MENLFDNFINADFNDNLLAEIPEGFCMDMQFWGQKKDGIFSINVHYEDSNSEKFDIEAEGRTSDELLDNLIIQFSNIEFSA